MVVSRETSFGYGLVSREALEQLIDFLASDFDRLAVEVGP
jgi:hypothetical protein